MPEERVVGDIRAGRLTAEQCAANFADLVAPLKPNEARVAAERCLFCYDAPCVTACPTSIDIPLFIRQIANGQPVAAAKTILDANIMGAMCARVCPTENLCEGACVKETSETRAVEIGASSVTRPMRVRCRKNSSTPRASPLAKPWRWWALAGGPRLRSCPRSKWTPGHDLRGEAEGRRPKRVRHRGLQGE